MNEIDDNNEQKEQHQFLDDKISSNKKESKFSLNKDAKKKLKVIIVIFCLGILGLIVALLIMYSIKGDYNRLDIDTHDNDNIEDKENGNGNKKDEENKKEEIEHHYPFPENEELSFTEEGHRLFSREVASQTIVLATNNGLPIEDTDQIVLFGEGTSDTIYGGIGSGAVYNKGTNVPVAPIMVLEGIENKIKENKTKFIYIKNEIGYEVGIKGLNGNNLTESDIQNFGTKKEGAERSVAIFTISKISGESIDKPHDRSRIGTMLSESEINTYDLLKKYFDHIVVVLNVGSVIELNGMEKDEKTSILISFYPGVEAGNAIADILVGDINPSGHLTDTWASKIEDYPTTSSFIENDLYVKYKEGLFVGYRYFEEDNEKQSKVVFPFGHGLSYTSFDLENNCLFDKRTKMFTITSKVTNIGNRKGKQVVQVYVKKPENNKFVKVQRELVTFGKTKELDVGEYETLTMKFNVDYLTSYDDTGITGNPASYVLEEGFYEIYVGDSVASTRDPKNLLCTYIHKHFNVTQQLTNRLFPSDSEDLDANIKPNFEKLFSKNDFEKYNAKQTEKLKYNSLIQNSLQKNNFRKLIENNTTKFDDKDDYSILPTNKFSEINFKTVLDKNYTMEQLVESMSNEELAFLSYGKPSLVNNGKGIIGGLYNSNLTGKYNIPYAETVDGPAGIHQSKLKMGSTAFPCATALASSFDLNLIQKVGEEIAKEARNINCNILLAPSINIHRNPLCGRNFEYYSEDPYLTGKVAAAFIKGVQSKRVSATLKHFALNNKETNKNGENDSLEKLSSDSRVSERVMREIYLKGFEIAIKEGNPWSLMTSYNRINGMKASESYDLLTGILREEWKYKGLVMTDWDNSSKNDREAHAGSGVKMPSNIEGSETILKGLKQGTVTRKDLKRNVLYTLNTLAKTASIDSLYKDPENMINITNSTIRIKVVDKWYRRYPDIGYEDCKDEDKGKNPTRTFSNTWISFFINNEEEQYRRFRIRYSSVWKRFGVSFSKYDDTLGEITNLESTWGWQEWKTSSIATIKLPKGKYELTMRFLGYDYYSNSYIDNNKGKINWIEIL